MSNVAYRAAITSIAAAEANGQDVEDRIAGVADACGLDADMIRHEVAELSQG